MKENPKRCRLTLAEIVLSTSHNILWNIWINKKNGSAFLWIIDSLNNSNFANNISQISQNNIVSKKNTYILLEYIYKKKDLFLYKITVV